MFKIRLHTCRIILLTSLVWFLAVVVILSLYSTDCLGGDCKKSREYDVMLSEAEVGALQQKKVEERENQIKESKHADPSNQHGVDATYKTYSLKRWKAAPTVLPISGLPGEMGKAVHIPSDQEAIMKEKFKLNQFNLMASDMISLNRSLSDVRLEGFVFFLLLDF